VGRAYNSVPTPFTAGGAPPFPAASERASAWAGIPQGAAEVAEGPAARVPVGGTAAVPEGAAARGGGGASIRLDASEMTAPELLREPSVRPTSARAASLPNEGGGGGVSGRDIYNKYYLYLYLFTYIYIFR